MKKELVLSLFMLGASCAYVTPQQAVNIDAVDQATNTLMPWAAAGLKSEIAAQDSIANDGSMAVEVRREAIARSFQLRGYLLETLILPRVTAPIRDWAVAHVGTAAFLAEKSKRRLLAESSSNGAD